MAVGSERLPVHHPGRRRLSRPPTGQAASTLPRTPSRNSTTLLVARKVRGPSPAPVIEQAPGPSGSTYGRRKPTSRRRANRSPYPAHPNWLTLDTTRLRTAIATRTSVQPTMSPDPLWVENRIAGTCGRPFGCSSRTMPWGQRCRWSSIATTVVGGARRTLSIEEALLLASTTMSELHPCPPRHAPQRPVAGHLRTGPRPVPDGSRRQRSALALTSAWLGFVTELQDWTSHK